MCEFKCLGSLAKVFRRIRSFCPKWWISGSLKCPFLFCNFIENFLKMWIKLIIYFSAIRISFLNAVSRRNVMAKIPSKIWHFCGGKLELWWAARRLSNVLCTVNCVLMWHLGKEDSEFLTDLCVYPSSVVTDPYLYLFLFSPSQRCIQLLQICSPSSFAWSHFSLGNLYFLFHMIP